MPDRPVAPPAVIIGNPASLFPRHLAALWRSFGLDVRIVTRHWAGERVLPDGTPILASAESESPAERRAYRTLGRLLGAFEARLQGWQRDRYRAAMGSETHYTPLASPAIVDALSIARFTRALRPQFVCGQEVFAYGLAASLCRGCPRLVMPWGGDVYMYAETTSLAFALVKYALRHVDLVVAGSPLAARHLQSRFGVPPERLHCGGLWALDYERFRRATPDENLRIRSRYGIRPDDLVIMNVRRFFPAWGSDVAFHAFVRFAKEWPAAHFVLLGGAGTEALVATARETLHKEGLTSRFTLFDGDLPLPDCAALMSIADIYVSLMREIDMRPLASILEAACAGGAPVIGDQPEYRAMEALGFSALFVEPGDRDAAVAALRQYAANPSLRRTVVENNARYLREHEDGVSQAQNLLRKVSALRHAHARPPQGSGGV
jgi:glycosyltransferase involved in cell wall biosynthesis